MRRILYLFLAGLLALGCKKDAPVTTPCGFDLKVDWVKGSRAQFTVTPDAENAYYCYGVIAADHPLYNKSDAEVIQFQMDWMNSDYANLRKEGKSEGDFLDLFCFKGARTVKSILLPPDMEHKLLVFQMNPKTCECIGPLHTKVFRTQAIPSVDLTFTIQCKDNRFRILPSDKNVPWFWEYEKEEKVMDVYANPYFFFYDIIGMYDEYGFLVHSFSYGDEDWEFPRDDKAVKEGVRYIMAMSACTDDGEICSDVSYTEFVYQDGKITFSNADFPIEPME